MLIQRRPAPPLDRFIEAIWFCRNDPGPRRLERILPTGAPQLIVNLKEDATRVYTSHDGREVCHASPGTIVSGIATRFQIIDTDEQQHVLGVSFRPGGTIAFFTAPADELRDVDVPVEALWGSRGAARLREQLLSATDPVAALEALERALADAWSARQLHPAVAFALDQFTARPSVARIGAVTDAIGLSPKRFIERFKIEVGVTPKRYCRLLRFQRAVSRAHRAARVDWGQLALACGYFDQPHFIHDFQSFAGLTPTDYEAARTRFANHVNFLQSGNA